MCSGNEQQFDGQVHVCEEGGGFGCWTDPLLEASGEVQTSADVYKRVSTNSL